MVDVNVWSYALNFVKDYQRAMETDEGSYQQQELRPTGVLEN